MRLRGLAMAVLAAIAFGYAVNSAASAPGGIAGELGRRYRAELAELDRQADHQRKRARRQLDRIGGGTGIAPPAKVTELYRRDVPARYRAAYAAGARACRGLRPTWLAAIGKVESDHGRDPGPGVHSGENYAGAGGPMQFLSGTWAQYGRGDRYRIEDAAPAAARLLCASGAPGDMSSAVFAYNHAWWYVAKVRTWEARYRSGHF